MAELADALASGASNRKIVEVQVLSRGPDRKENMAKVKVAKLNRNNNHRHSVKRMRKMLKYLKNGK